MKVKRIVIESAGGDATLTRDGQEIRIDGRRLVKAIETKGGKAALVSERFDWTLNAGGTVEITREAERLQRCLEAYKGSRGDVIEYEHLIEMLID